MIIQLIEIPEEGMQIEGEEPSSILELTGDPALAISPIRYSMHVGVTETGLFAVGTLAVDVECTCVRCLEKFQRPIERPDFATQIELKNRETVDLTDEVREDILLALPAHPHCNWNGEKACKADFPIAIDPEKAASDRREVWKGLDKLKL